MANGFPLDSKDLTKFGGNLKSYRSLRLARITDLNVTRGTLSIRWMDYPGERDDVVISQSGFGSWEFPVIGGVVLIGMREDIPELLRYMPMGYAKSVEALNAPQLQPGEKVFESYQDNAGSTPLTTGTQIKMDNLGRVRISDASGDSWVLDSELNLIKSESMDHQIDTEAGRLEFGILYNTDEDIVYDNGQILPSPLSHFRLRVLEHADYTNLENIDNPIVELNIGTKLDSETGEPELTTAADAVADKQIAIHLGTSAGINFNFLVDKEGNVTMKVKGDKKFKLVCDDIEFGGDGMEQPVVLKNFITSYYLTHQHIGNLGAPTSVPIVFPNTSPTTTSITNVVSKSTKAE